MLILGIETTCDETAAAILEAKGGRLAVLSNVVSSQVKLHARWGGVVPNLAAREHLKNILPVIEAALKEAKAASKDIDLIAVAEGPGLIPALLVGTSAAKTLSYLWRKPLLGVHHIEGHIYANFIGENFIQSSAFPSRPDVSGQDSSKPSFIKFPILCLVVSGGHTQLVLMEDHLQYKIIGQTLDDAAGEAFDKVARILGLSYPGGPAVAATAAQFKTQSLKFKVNLPRPMINSKDFNFSFSGLKTAVLYTVKKNPKILKDKQSVTALCAEFQQAVLDVLIAKTLAVAEKYRPRAIMLAGGVSANQELRQQLEKAIQEKFPNIEYRIPETKYSVDNAAMIATAGFFRWQKMSIEKRKQSLRQWQKLQPDANLKIS